MHEGILSPSSSRIRKTRPIRPSHAFIFAQPFTTYYHRRVDLTKGKDTAHFIYRSRCASNVCQPIVYVTICGVVGMRMVASNSNSVRSWFENERKEVSPLSKLRRRGISQRFRQRRHDNAMPRLPYRGHFAGGRRGGKAEGRGAQTGPAAIAIQEPLKRGRTAWPGQSQLHPLFNCGMLC